MVGGADDGVQQVTDRIEIKTVADFFAIPAEKRAHCLRDFATWLAMASEAKAFFAGIEGVIMPTDTFIWLDDGKHDAHIHITVRGDQP